MPQTRKRNYSDVTAISTPRVLKKQARRALSDTAAESHGSHTGEPERTTLEPEGNFQYRQVRVDSDDRDSLVFEDALALLSPTSTVQQNSAPQQVIIALEQQEVHIPVQDAAFVAPTDRLPDFVRPSLAPQHRPANPEQQLQPTELLTSIDAAQQRPYHASQAPASLPFAQQGNETAASHGNEGAESSAVPRNDAICNMNENDDTAAAAKCRLPPMWRAQPTVWFYQAESILDVSRVHTDRSKYNLLVAALDPETLADVADTLASPPEEGRYEALKARILQRLVDPPDRQLQKMLSELQLDGRKPSQLYRHMKTLAGNLATDSVIRAFYVAYMEAGISPSLI